MGSIGPAEILVVLIVALLVLGPSKLPDAARSLGRAIGEVRRYTYGFQEEVRDAFSEPQYSEPQYSEPQYSEPQDSEPQPSESQASKSQAFERQASVPEPSRPYPSQPDNGDADAS